MFNTGIIRVTLRKIVYLFLVISAHLWRKVLIKTSFIAITGSVGKTTTKECIAAVLSSKHSIIKTKNNRNDLWGVPITILRVRPWHKYAVVETGTDKKGNMQKFAKLIKPDIAIVLKVALVHMRAFETLEDVAEEKSNLLKYLPVNGFAILNNDDKYVIKMRENIKCKVKTFGHSSDSDLWAENISSYFPQNLSFTVKTKSESEYVKTELIGGHWTNSVLASLLTASICNISLKDALKVIEKVKPFMGRMQQVHLPSGAIVIRDDYSGSFNTLKSSLEVLKNTGAKRRILIIGNISDSSYDARRRCQKVGTFASQVSDVAVFIGRDGRYSVKTAIDGGMKQENVFHFNELFQSLDFLNSELKEGDVVLLKGRTTDHLSRLLFAQFGNIECRKIRCSKRIACDICDELKPDFNLNLIYNY